MIKRVDNNGQVHLVTNIRKPRKWRRFEYLQSSGIQHINTGYKPNGDTRVVMKFQYTSYNRPSALFGARNTISGSGANNFNLWCQSNLFAAQYNGNDWTANQKSVDLGTSEPFIVDYNKNICTVKEVSATFTKASFTVNYNLLLLALQDVNGVDNRKSAGKLYYCKVYDKDVLIRDFVPAEYNGQYGLWDLVEDKFYPNKGTGSFTVGPEMKNYDEIYEVRKTSSLLPAGVELYDYIQSSGTQWIDTGYLMNGDNYEINIDAQQGTTTETIYGFQATTQLCTLHQGDIYWNGSTSVGTNRNKNVGTASTFTSRFTLNIKANSGTINYKLNNTTGSYACRYTSFSGVQHTMHLFASNYYNNDHRYSTGKVYSFTIKQGGNLIRNLIPCTYLGEPGMWDTVENKFYRNQGTGQFTLGNKITLKEYEYLQGDGNAYIQESVNSTINSLKWEGLVATPSISSSSRYFIASDSLADKGHYIEFTSRKFGQVTCYQTVNITQNQLYKCEMYINGSTSTISKIQDNDQEYTLTQLSYQGAINNQFSLFRINDQYKSPTGLRIGNNKLYINNQLVRDFIPVSYNGTPGLWDKVEWKFYGNVGSGNFTLGPEKASGIYPVWTPIEYLESTGTQYINTGHVLKNTDIVDVTYDRMTVGWVFGSRASSGSQYSAITNEDNGSSTYNIRYGNTILYTTSPQPSGTVTVHIESGNTKVNGSTVSTTAYGSSFYSGNCYLFTINNNGTAYSGTYGTNRIRRFSIQGACDMIPVRIGNIGYMFDKVTGKMFGNSGTGNFILGPDINL